MCLDFSKMLLGVGVEAGPGWRVRNGEADALTNYFFMFFFSS